MLIVEAQNRSKIRTRVGAKAVVTPFGIIFFNFIPLQTQFFMIGRQEAWLVGRP